MADSKFNQFALILVFGFMAICFVGALYGSNAVESLLQIG